jgi:hypothetical protein
MIPLPESVRLTVREASEFQDASLLKRAYEDVLFSLKGPPDERVGRDILVLCAEAALKVSRVASRLQPKILPSASAYTPVCIHPLAHNADCF